MYPLQKLVELCTISNAYVVFGTTLGREHCAPMLSRKYEMQRSPTAYALFHITMSWIVL